MKEPWKITYFIVFRFLRRLMWVYFVIFHKIKFVNTDKVPKKGGLIVMPNHSSYFDPPTAGALGFKRNCRFMARDTLFKNKIFGCIIGNLGAFPVKRGRVDRGAWDKFIELVKAGWAVMFFPEGTRTLTGEIQDGKPGTGMLVYQTKGKVLPVYIHGAFEAWPKGGKPKLFTPITIVYGDVMSFDDLFEKPEGREVYEEITARVINRLREMKADYLKNQGDKIN